MKRIVISSMLFLMAILTLQSQTIVADWKIKQMGLDVYDMQSVNTLVGFLIVQKGDVIFNVTDVDSKETILAVSIDGLYFDQTATENSSYNEMRSGFADANFLPLHENSQISLCTRSLIWGYKEYTNSVGIGCGGCGSYGLNSNPDGTTKPPCMIMVDVNGDRKPNPANINCKHPNKCPENAYKTSDPLGLKLTDLFTIMITDREAIPYGVAAQRAMYQAQAKK